MTHVFFYVLHSKNVCSARLQMCEKLRDIVLNKDRAPRTFEAHVEFITDNESDELVKRPGGIAGLVDMSQESLKEYPDLSNTPRSMHINQLSCAMKHLSALEKIASQAATTEEKRFYIVLEDDCLFGEEAHLCERLNDIFVNLPTDFDMMFLGLPSPQTDAVDNERIIVVNDKLKYHRLSKVPSMMMPILPCCDSYMLTPSAAERLLQFSRPIRLPANLQLTWSIRKASLNVYASMPNVFVDGSKIGVYVSQIDPNNRLLWNEQFLKLESLVNNVDQIVTSQENLKAAQDFIDKLQFKTHPDILRLIGKLQMRMGNAVEARVIFDQVYRVYTTENCVLNSSSQFLRDYMTVFGKLQSDINL